MGRKRRHLQLPPPASARAHALRLPKHTITFTCLASVVLLAAMAIAYRPKPVESGQSGEATSSPLALRPPAAIPTLEELLAMPPGQLQTLDIAMMDLVCAAGLPGAEKLNIPATLVRLDGWAVHVQEVTQRHLYRAHDPQWADHYKHSENWLRAEFLAQVLQEDCGVHYNMDRIRNINFTNSKDLFIHGMIDDANGGTCASMPVLYVAVGRRLGYPLKLVFSKEHAFARWDGATERFNIETTGNGGTDSYPDEHYTEWPEKSSPVEIKANRYLISLSPAEELAAFLCDRGHCLLDNGRTKEARDTYAAAQKLAPDTASYADWLAVAETRLNPRPMDYRHRPYVAGPLDPAPDRINAANRGAMRPYVRPPTPPQRPAPPLYNGAPPFSPSPAPAQPRR